MEDRTIIQPALRGSVLRGVRLNGIYEIETLIAQGGMGEVYKGFNIQTNDPVAIKMILPELASNPDAFALFRREASTLHNLQHEAIVRYFVFTVDPELQRAYLAMEFVDGPSLKKRLTEGPLPLDQVKILQKRIGGALEAAHRFGVIHRDISSDNVILPDADPNRAKIIDFGIARSQRPGEGTIIGDGFAGKYNYVSPEQLGLFGGEVTAKSDIYSFGLVLAEALRGRPIDMNGTQVEIIEKRRAVPDLSDIDPSMRPLIQAMLQPLPANRPPSMAAVAVYEGPAGAPRHPDRGERSARTPAPARDGGSSAGRIAALAALVIVIGSLAGVGYVFRDSLPWPVSTAPPTPTPTQTPTALPTLPPLPSPTPSLTPSPSPSLTPTPSPMATPTPTPTVPSAGDIINSAPPHAPQASLTLDAASVGKEYSIDLPAFTNSVKGEGLLLRVDPAPPEGLVFSDLGLGHGRISGAPSKPGQYSFDIIGANKMGDFIRMPTTLTVTPSTPSKPIPTQTPTKPPTSPPHAPIAELSIEDAMVGTEYRAELPAFSDPEGVQGLTLRASSKLPDGLRFDDLGLGVGAISGTPRQAERVALEITATNAGGASAHMGVKLNIAAARPTPTPTPTATPTPTPAPTPAPSKTQSTRPQPAQASLPLGDAIVGQDYSADLPPFSDPGGNSGLALHAEPNPPAGLTFVDLGSGFGQISGKPAVAGRYVFDVIATNEAGASARMTAQLTIAPAVALSPSPTPVPLPSPTVVAAKTPTEKAGDFLRGFDGGSCFLARPAGAAGDPLTIEGIGSDEATFRRFYNEFIRDVGVEPKVNVRTIAAAACPALDLIRASGGGSVNAPKVSLSAFDIGRGKPLTGSVSNLSGRHLDLLVITNDGQAHRLDTRPQGGAASFNQPMTADAASLSALQILIAIAAPTQPPSLEGFRSGRAEDILPRLRADLADPASAMDFEFFRLVN